MRIGQHHPGRAGNARRSNRSTHRRRSAAGRRARCSRLLFEQLESRTLLAADLLSDTELLQDDVVESDPAPEIAELAGVGQETAILSAEGEGEGENGDARDLRAFAELLFLNDVTFYGSDWCPNCVALKKSFEDGAQSLRYVDLFNPDDTRNDILPELKWQPAMSFPDGNGGTTLIDDQERLTLERISALTGIPIPLSSTPWLKPIDAPQTVLSGSPFHIPLDAYDPNGDPLSYDITVRDADGNLTDLVTAEVLENNRSMKIGLLSRPSNEPGVPGVSPAFHTYYLGEMVFELFEQRAPDPTGRVIELVESGHYDDRYMWRLERGFVSQFGGDTPTSGGHSSLGVFDDQFHVDLQHNRDGILSYAKNIDDSNDAEFFLTLDETRWLDFNHSIFGQMVEGFELIEIIEEEPVFVAHPDGDENPNNDFHNPEYPKQIGAIEVFPDTENGVAMLKAHPDAIDQTFTLTVTATDGVHTSPPINIHVEVKDDIPEFGGANGAPFLEEIGAVVTPRNTWVDIQLSSIDVEGDPVKYGAQIIGDVPYTGQLDSETGLVTITPPDDFVGELEIRVGVGALNGPDPFDPLFPNAPRDTQDVTITVLGPPSIDLLPASDSNVDNDNVTSATNLTVEVSDVVSGAQVEVLDGNTVIGQGTANSNINVNTGGLGDGVHTLTARQTLADVSSERSAGLQVTVDTQAPAAFTSTAPTKATVGVALEYDAANPEEGAPGLYSLVGAPDGVLIHADTGVMTWTPAQGQVGTHNFQVVATDLAGNSTPQNISIEVFVPRVRIRLSAADLLGNRITHIQPGSDFLLQGILKDVRPSKIADGVFAAYMDIAYNASLVSSRADGPGDVTFGDDYPNDKSGDFATAGLIDEIGSFSSSISEPLGSTERVQFSIPMTATTVGEASFTLDSAEGLGHDVLVYRTGTVDESELVVPPEEVVYLGTTLVIGDGLIARDDIFNVNEDSSDVALDVINNPEGKDENPQGGEIIIISVGDTSNDGKVTISAGKTLSYTAASDVFGEDKFTYTISNGQSTSTATVTVQISPKNDDPTAVDDTATVDQDSQDNPLFVLGNDTIAPDEGETLKVMGVDPSKGGKVRIASNGTHLVYAPLAGFVGQEIINYTISDGTTTANAKVTVTVEEGSKPTAGDDEATVAEDSGVNVINVLANDSPAEDDRALRVTNVTQPLTDGTVSIGGGGANVLYTPEADFSGTHKFTYTVAETDGGESIATVTVTVSGRNDPPVANNDELNVTKNSQNNRLEVLANDTDQPDTGETFRITDVTLDSVDQGSEWSISEDGQSLQYSPATDFVGQETLAYTVNDRDDGSGLTDQATVTVNVAESTVSGRIITVGTQTPIRGLQLSLNRTDGQNGPADTSDETRPDGSVEFAVTPGAYMVTADPPFLTPIETEVQVESGGNAVFALPTVGREARFIGIADFRADAPGQSLLSPQNAILAAVTPGGAQVAGEGEHDSGQNLGEQHWYSVEAGWGDYLDVEVQLSEDLSQITLIATAADGQKDTVTISAADAQLVKFLGREGEAHLIRITVDPASLDWQQDCTDESGTCSIEGEGEAAETTVATPNQLALATTPIDVTPTDAASDAPPFVEQDAEGESTAAAEPTVTTPVISVTEPVSVQTSDLGISETVTETAESLDLPTLADPGLGAVDTPGDSTVVQADDGAPSAEELTTTDAVDEVLTETAHGIESMERDLVLIASQSEADDFAQAVDWLLASDLG
ncbi:MAG: tandem-95 repeat protein [Planctomycetes bacterium]|nr:tandem-95 repeat protein [Planctomycetota bacterium]MBL7041460.1 tandem-95 repeat protein [Pirellulaceae bacterium]